MFWYNHIYFGTIIYNVRELEKLSHYLLKLFINLLIYLLKFSNATFSKMQHSLLHLY